MENIDFAEFISNIRAIQEIDLAEKIPTNKENTSFQNGDAERILRLIIKLYQKIDVDCLGDFPTAMLEDFSKQALSDLELFTGLTPYYSRSSFAALKERLDGARNTAFSTFLPVIGYSTTAQFQNQQKNQWQKELDTFKVTATERENSVHIQLQKATDIATNLEEMSAQIGVVTQAMHFNQEAMLHSEKAIRWGRKTIYAGFTLGLFSLLSLSLSYVPSLRPVDGLQAIQIATGKILFFAVLAYWLMLCAKNFMAHKHNEIINRHRENALKTFKALTDGAVNPDSKDIVLTHASQCIFSPQDTGYSKLSSGTDSGVKSIIEIVPKILSKSGS